MIQGTLTFPNQKTPVKTKRKDQEPQTKKEIIKERKLPLTRPKTLSSNLQALEKIRRKQFPSEVFNIELPEILSPEELLSLFYISYQKEIDRKQIKEIIEEKVKKLKEIFYQKNKEESFPELEQLQKRIFHQESTFQEFIEVYKEVYKKTLNKEKIPSNKWNKIFPILEMVPIKMISRINIFSNEVHSLLKAVSTKQQKIFFTEKDYLKSYIAQQSINGIHVGTHFSTSLKDIKDSSIDFAILKINEKKVSVKKEDIIEIRKNTVSKKLIENNTAKEGLITYEAIHPKLKNFGVSIIIGPADILSNKKIHFKKHEIVAIPIFTIYYTDKNSDNKIITTVNAIDKDGKIREVKVNSAISVMCKMEEKEFLKSPLKQDPPAFYVQSIEEVEKIKQTPQFKEIEKSINYINETKISKQVKELLLSLSKELVNEYKSKGSFLKASMIKELYEKLENQSTKEINLNEYLQKIYSYTKEEKRIENLIRIKIMRQAKENIINPVKEQQINNIKNLAERTFIKLKSDDILTLLHLKTVIHILQDNKQSLLEISPGGLFKSEGQTRYAKPFEFMFCKNDFINLCLHVSKDYHRREKMIEFLKDTLKQIKTIKKNPQPELRHTTNELLKLINSATRKNFKKLSHAIEYVFSYNENLSIDKIALLSWKKKNPKNETIHIFAEILQHVSNKYHIKVIRHNTMSKIYSEMPSVIQKVKDLYAYIENKEEVASKITIKKTLEKIEELETELKNLKV